MKTLEEHLLDVRVVIKQIRHRSEPTQCDLQSFPWKNWSRVVKFAMKDLGMEDWNFQDVEASRYLSPSFLKILEERLKKEQLYRKFGL